MGNYNNGGNRGFGNRGGGGGYGGRGGGGRGGGRDRGGSSMHPATCSDCGKRCEVPFRPSGDKPVYCSDCFEDSGKSGGRDSGGRGRDGGRDFGGRGRDRGRSDSRDREMFKAVCADCGEKCEVPFKPTGNKPVLCSNCFGGSGKAGGGNSGVSEEKFEELNKKLDKILRVLEIAHPKKTHVIKKSDAEAYSFDKDESEEKPAKKVAKKKAAPKKKVAKKAVKKAAPKKPASTKAERKAAKKAPAKKKKK